MPSASFMLFATWRRNLWNSLMMKKWLLLLGTKLEIGRVLSNCQASLESWRNLKWSWKWTLISMTYGLTVHLLANESLFILHNDMLSQERNFPTSPSALGNTGPIPDTKDNRDTKIDIAPTHPRRDPSLGIVQPDMTSTAAPTTSTDPVIHPNQPSVASTPQNILPRAGLRCWYFWPIRCQTKKKFHCANKYSYQWLCEVGTLDPGRILDDMTCPKVIHEGAIRLLIEAPFCTPGAFHVWHQRGDVMATIDFTFRTLRINIQTKRKLTILGRGQAVSQHKLNTTSGKQHLLS